MTLWEAALIFIAGIGAGTINTVVGSGTLITFPTLVALGMPPVTANVTNTVGLFPGAFVGAWGYRRELTGQRQRAIWLGAASVVGAVGGAILLLKLPASAFDAIVPALIVAALLLVIFGRRITRAMARSDHRPGSRTTPLLWALVLGSGVYGGYFGAGQGILLMGLFGVLLAEPIQRQNALKNLLAGMVNMVAAIVFIATAHIDWAAAGIIVVGSMIGGYTGARVGRRIPAPVLRAIIVVVGTIAVVKLVWF